MDDVVTAVMDAIRNADPDYGAPTLEPLRPADHRIGTLSEASRRIHAVLTLQFQRYGAHLREGARISADPALKSDPNVTTEWLIGNRGLVFRIRILQAMLQLATLADCNEVVLHESVEYRQGFVIVWTEHPASRYDPFSDAMDAFFRGDIPGKSS